MFADLPLLNDLRHVLAAVPLWAVLGVIFGLVTLLIYAIGRRFLSRSPKEDERLRQIRGDTSTAVDTEPGIFGALTPALAMQIPETEKERRDFQLMLRQAGMYSPAASQSIYAARFVLLLLPLLIAGVCIVVMDRQWTFRILLAGVFAAAILVVIPRLYVYFRRRRRIAKIREGLPDMIDMLGMCVSGGLGLGASLENVARRMTGYPECAMELLLLKRQSELGSIKLALADFAARVDLPETAQLASLLARSSNLGTELEGSLANQADHLRLARRQAAETHANKMPVKLIFPIMFCFAPAVLIILTAPAVMQLREFLAGRNTPAGVRESILAPRNAPGPLATAPEGELTISPGMNDRRPAGR